MTPREKLDAIKRAEHEFIRKVEELKRNYWIKVKEISRAKDSDRMQAIRKELGMP